MFTSGYFRLLFFVPLLCAASVPAQQPSAQAPSSAGKIVLDVEVTQKSGQPVVDLQQQDFTLLDNKAPQTLTSFEAVDGRKASINLILVVDAVNAGYQNVAYERGQVDKFLRAEGGSLAHPMTLAVLTDRGIQIGANSSLDGNALSAALDQYTVGLRDVRRSDGVYGAEELFQLSLNGLENLIARESQLPGRKIVLWVSPGWPLLSGPNIDLDGKQQQQLFTNITGFATQFLQGRMTLDSIDPLGTADSAGFGNFYWKEFAKGVSKPGQAQAGNLALQVLANESGGLTVSSSNDTAALLQQCMADTAAYYEISFDPPQGHRPNEYHRLEVRIAKPGLTARTLEGYYSQP